MDSCKIITARRCLSAALLASGAASVLAQVSYYTPPDATGIHRYVAPSDHPAALMKALKAGQVKSKTPPPTEAKASNTYDRTNHLPLKVVTGPALQAGHYRLVPLGE